MPTNWEDAEQEALVDWANTFMEHIPELDYLYAIPNGGKRARKTAATMKRTGQRKGVLDLCLAYPMPGWHGYYIELKATYPDGRVGTLSKDQREWITKLSAVGYKTGVFYGWEAAALSILQYLQVPNPDQYLPPIPF